MTTYTAHNGRKVELDDPTVDDLIALAHITREDTSALAARAVEQLRRELVPTALRRVPSPAAATPGGRRRRQDTPVDGADAHEEASA